MNSFIWVYVEHKNGEINEASLEILGEAQKLSSRMKSKVCAVLLGNNIASFSKELIAYGADIVIMFEAPRYVNFDPELYINAFSVIYKEYPPRIVLIASTQNGISIAPRLASRLKYGFAANTVTTAIQSDGSLLINRSVCLGKVHCVVEYSSNKGVIVTMQPGSIGLEKPNQSRKGEVINMELEEKIGSNTKVEGYVKADPESVALDEAELVVAGGLGFRKQEELELIKSLGKALGAAVGGSKPTVDQGWLPRKRLIGQSSGRKIYPRLFIGAGISGTNYFLEGMKDSHLIIAINQDKGAPLMKLADLAVVGDLYEILPGLTKQLIERQEKKV